LSSSLGLNRRNRHPIFSGTSAGSDNTVR
jgi:hypothetical protein